VIQTSENKTKCFKTVSPKRAKTHAIILKYICIIFIKMIGILQLANMFLFARKLSLEKETKCPN
jgi:hypothetical protein